MATIALTDVHGRFDCLEAMCEALDKKLSGRGHKLVLLGDYIDRGPDSQKVVEAVRKGPEYFKFASEVVVLKGNHEELFIDAVKNSRLSTFLNNGGVQTLMSFLGKTKDEVMDLCYGEGKNFFMEKDGAGLKDFPDLLETANFFETLDLFHIDEKFFFVHAGIKPDVAIKDQIADPKTYANNFIWIRDPFLRNNDDHGYHIVHGHTPHDHDMWYSTKNGKRFHRTNLDSAAFYYGTLTGLIIHDTADRKSRELVTVDCGKAKGLGW